MAQRELVYVAGLCTCLAGAYLKNIYIQYFSLYYYSRGMTDKDGIRANNQPEVCSESRPSLGLDDRANETSLTSPCTLGLLCVCVLADEDVRPKREEFVCEFGLKRTSGLNRGRGESL